MAGSNRSVDRALDVLCVIARTRGLRFTDLLDRTDIPRATLHGLLMSLESAGFVQRTDAGYQIGVVAFEVGAAMPVSASLREELRPVLDELAASTGEACHLGTLSGTDVVYLDRRDTGDGLRFISRIGQRLPAHATGLGKAMLALSDEAELTSWYPAQLERLTPNGVGDRAELLREVAVIRERGYSTESEESTPGVCCIGMAVPAPNGPLGVSITVPVQRATVAELPRFLPQLHTAIEHIRTRTRAHHWFGPDRGTPAGQDRDR